MLLNKFDDMARCFECKVSGRFILALGCDTSITLAHFLRFLTHCICTFYICFITNWKLV